MDPALRLAAAASRKASQDAPLSDQDSYVRNTVDTAILSAHPLKA